MNSDKELLNSNILIVDDEDINIQILERYLKENEFTSVQSLTDPRKGLEIFKEGNIDLVLLNFKMPFLSGFDFMKSIRGRKDDLPLPVLILTVISYQEAISRSFELGAADYITKPFMEMEVVTRIINLLRIFYYRKKIARNNEFLEEKVKERTTDLSKVRSFNLQKTG